MGEVLLSISIADEEDEWVDHLIYLGSTIAKQRVA